MHRYWIARLLITALLAIPVSAIAHGNDRYSMDDLLALEKTESWRELWAHLLDIKPSRRNTIWRQLGTTVTQARLNAPYPIGQPERQFVFVVEALDQLPFLKDNPDFMRSRTDIGLRKLESCFQSGTPKACRNNFLAFIQQAPDDRDLAFAAGKIVRRKMSYAYAMAFFYHALNGAPTLARCDDEDVWLALSAALDLRNAKSEALRMAKDVGFGTCWENLQGKLIDSVTDTPKRMQHICSSLLEKKALKGVRLKKCQKITKQSK